MITGSLPRALGLSSLSLVVGYLFAAFVGVSSGLVMGWYRCLEEALEIYLSLLIVIPMISIVPVVILLWGFGITSRAIVIFLFALPLIALNTIAGVKNVDATLIEMSRSFQANRRQLFFSILLPAALPAIISGLRLGMGQAFIGVVAAETLVSATGLGNLIALYSSQFKSGHVFATLLTVIALAVFVMGVLQKIESKLLIWKLANSDNHG